MKLVFNINFNTRFGQNLFLNLNGEDYPMVFAGGGNWSVEIEGDFQDIEYCYRVEDSGSTLYEAGARRHSLISRKAENVIFNDSWQGFDENTPFLSVPFTDVFYQHKTANVVYGKKNNEVVVRAIIPLVATDEEVFLVGNIAELGAWNPDNALKMSYTGGCRWEVSLKFFSSFEYKFIRKSSCGLEWEGGENHRFASAVPGGRTTVVTEHSAVAFAPRRPRVAGVAIPVFSLKSKNSFGIGDFLDIKLLVKWAVKTGQKVIQLLPVNDTTSTRTWTDSYPYSGISIMALHPVYLNLKDMGEPADKLVKTAFEKAGKLYNRMPQVDYEKVLALKMEYARIIFDEKGEEICSSDDYKSFYERNKEWLLPYSAFCYLRDKYKTADFSKWGKYAHYDIKAIEKLSLSKPTGDQLRFHSFIQYFLDRQLRSARDFAHKNGVVLKGDIPIGITPHSVEAWKEPYYFNMDSQAGAPPDFFSADGQNWGFPTYNWERMAQDGYLWWKKRFTKMAEYFDAYRIDHVLGFFRIWEIPQGYKSGTMGHFSPALPYSREELMQRGMNLENFLEDPHKMGCYHPRINARGQGDWAFDALYDDFFYVRHNDFWKKEALKKLPALIASTQMLTCAEDLGMIPDCVPEVLDDLKILTLEIQRMPKDPSVGLGNPSYFPYRSVCTTGSHDTSTLRGWWGENHDGQECPVDVCRWIIAEHLHSPAMLCVLPLQDWTSVDEDVRAADTVSERINDPADAKHYWRYRMHVTLEELIGNTSFNEKISRMIEESGRRF